jgi:hypothetical protein
MPPVEEPAPTAPKETGIGMTPVPPEGVQPPTSTPQPPTSKAGPQTPGAMADTAVPDMRDPAERAKNPQAAAFYDQLGEQVKTGKISPEEAASAFGKYIHGVK